LNICHPRSRDLAARQRFVLQDAFDYTSAKHREGALRYGFAHGRRYDRSDRFLGFVILGSTCLGMLQQSGQQRALLRAENPVIPHECF
jgi:hypothetical protein